MSLRAVEEVSTQVPADDFQALEDKVYRTIELYKSAREARVVAERDVKRLREQLEEREEEVESLRREMVGLRKEREEVRSRVEKMMAQIDRMRRTSPKRRPHRPGIPRLLRPQARRGQTPPTSSPVPSPTTPQRPLGHAARPHPSTKTQPPQRLDKPIENRSRRIRRTGSDLAWPSSRLSDPLRHRPSRRWAAAEGAVRAHAHDSFRGSFSRIGSRFLAAITVLDAR